MESGVIESAFEHGELRVLDGGDIGEQRGYRASELAVDFDSIELSLRHHLVTVAAGGRAAITRTGDSRRVMLIV